MHSFGTLTRFLCSTLGVFLIMGFLLPQPVSAQEAVIEGTITSALTGDPLPGANILLRGTNVGTATNVDGQYRLRIPATHVTDTERALVASFVGYRSSTQTITLTAGTHTVNFQLTDDVLGLEEVIVTGVVGATFRERLPFSVDLVTSRDLEQVPYTSAEQAIRGKVAGARVVQSSGQPGTGATIQLRGPTSIDTRGRSNQPLYVIDGVITAERHGIMTDIDALDIESIEVVKGAAAASLYGSRAAAGVIQITTRRGQDLGMGQTRVLFRNEFGINLLPDSPPKSQYHHYVTDAQGNFLDEDGNIVTNRGDADLDAWDGTAATAFRDKSYIQTYDAFDAFVDPGNFYLNTIQVSQRGEHTNFLASFSNSREGGIITNMHGYERQSVRLNVDHRVAENLMFNASAYYARSFRDMIDDRPDGGGPGSPFFGLLFTFPDVDLTQKDDDGDFVIKPDPALIEENPLYAIHNREFTQTRNRIMGSFRLNYQPWEWLNLETAVSYDRSNRNQEFYWPKGFKSIDQPIYERGVLEIGDFFDEALNVQVDAMFTREFGNLGTRTQVRYLAESWDYITHATTGRDFAVFGTKNISHTDPSQASMSSLTQKVRSEGFYLISGFDYDGRYITDFLVRRDGSSMFGPDERWHTYYRASAAYRMAQESWWTIDPINEFKLRYSIGTAGGRPSWAAQFETWSVVAGSVSKGALGNRDLKPEFSTEQEAGVEIGFFDRYMFEFTYAHTKTEDQILFTPLPGVAGFTGQWRNAGTLESWSYEASLRGQLMQTRDFSWSAAFHFDKTIQKITEFDLPPYRFGPVDYYWVQNSDVFYMREGEIYGSMYGNRFITNLNDLPEHLPRDQFQVNDDGYVVWVGQNSWRDGIANQLWGTSTTIEGRSFGWGMPIRYIDEDGNDFVRIGHVMPDFNLAFSNNVRYKGFNFYLLLDAQIGGDIYNQTKQWTYRDYMHADVDQAGKPDDRKKPIAYYSALYNVNNPSSHFVEDGTFLKLRELSVRYSFGRDQLRNLFGGWLQRVTVGVIGRNLLTLTNYSGFDPEIGMTQDAVTFRFDSFAYPNYRTFTGVLEIEF